MPDSAPCVPDDENSGRSSSRADTACFDDHRLSSVSTPSTTTTSCDAWDAFRVVNDDFVENDSKSSRQRGFLFSGCMRVAKLLAYLVTFAVVLAAGVATKSALLFVTSQLRPNPETISYCHENLGKLIVSFIQIEQLFPNLKSVHITYRYPVKLPDFTS
jgi:hypothetical protein